MKKNTILFLLLSSFLMHAQVPNWQWAVTTGADENNFAKDIAHDSQGNVYMTGMFNSSAIEFGSVMLNNSGFGTEIFIAKYSPSGSVLWAKSFGAGSLDDAWGIAADSNGNCYITGKYLGTSISFGNITLTNPQGQYNMFIVKFDVDGNVVWARNNGGTIGAVEAEDIAVDAQNNVIVAGYYGGSIIFDDVTLASSGNANLFIVKYNSEGDVLWATNRNEIISNRADGIDVDAEGNIYITGNYAQSGLFGLQLSNNGTNVYVAKFDAMGNFQWASAPAAFNSGSNYSYDVHVTAGGKVVIAGSYKTETLQFGDTILTRNGLNDDTFVAQYSASGEFEWAKSIGGTKDDRGYKLGSDSSGNVYVNGYFESDDLSFGGVALTKNNNYSKWSFVAKYSNAGNEIWAAKVVNSTTFSTSPNGGLTVDASDNVYVAGGAMDDCAFGTITIEDGGIFLAKMGNNTAGVDGFIKNTIKIHPNPVNDVLAISSAEKILTVAVYNTLGQKVMLTANSDTVDVSSLQAGLYIVEVTSDKGRMTQKVIKN